MAKEADIVPFLSNAGLINTTCFINELACNRSAPTLEVQKTKVMLSVLRTEPYRLFLVEDNPAEVRLIQEAIKEAQLGDLLELSFAYDGEEACEALDASKIMDKKFDLVLLDLNMPKVTGKEVLEKIKSDPDLESTPVIMVTNSDYKKDMIDCYRLRADGYFQKPADFKKLVDFFISVKKSIEVKNKLSIYFIEKIYDELAVAM